jgi:hypothetical protein
MPERAWDILAFVMLVCMIPMLLAVGLLLFDLVAERAS